MLSLGKDKHRPCWVKGSPCVESQVDIETFQQFNNSKRVGSKVQGFKDKSTYSKVRRRFREVWKEQRRMN